MEQAAQLAVQSFNEGKGKPFNGNDVRFTIKEPLLYAVFLSSPADGHGTVKVFAVSANPQLQGPAPGQTPANCL